MILFNRVVLIMYNEMIYEVQLKLYLFTIFVTMFLLQNEEKFGVKCYPCV